MPQDPLGPFEQQQQAQQAQQQDPPKKGKDKPPANPCQPDVWDPITGRLISNDVNNPA